MSQKLYVNKIHHHTPKPSLSPLLVLGGLALLAVVVLTLVFIALSPNHPNGGTPQLQVNSDRLELGKQIFGQSIRASFTIKNTGTGTLTLSAPSTPRVLQGCCPQRLVVEQPSLAPGQSTLVYTDMMMHEGMGGPHLFEIPLTTNDPAQPYKNLLVASDWEAN